MLFNGGKGLTWQAGIQTLLSRPLSPKCWYHFYHLILHAECCVSMERRIQLDGIQEHRKPSHPVSVCVHHACLASIGWICPIYLSVPICRDVPLDGHGPILEEPILDDICATCFIWTNIQFPVDAFNP